jgi:hypothetical protein
MIATIRCPHRAGSANSGRSSVQGLLLLCGICGQDSQAKHAPTLLVTANHARHAGGRSVSASPPMSAFPILNVRCWEHGQAAWGRLRSERHDMRGHTRSRSARLEADIHRRVAFTVKFRPGPFHCCPEKETGASWFMPVGAAARLRTFKSHLVASLQRQLSFECTSRLAGSHSSRRFWSSSGLKRSMLQ